jgi:lysozyme
MSERAAFDIAADFIASHEGLSLSAYWDAIGEVWTIGYGHAGSHPGATLKDEQAARTLLLQDMQQFERAVLEYIDGVVLNQNQLAALVSFEFNTGAGPSSGVWAHLHEGDFEGAMSVLKTWDHDGAGNVIPGLENRRNDEVALFNKK